MRYDISPQAIKGFLDPAEGEALYHAALAACELQACCLEVGSYCGKSTVYLGTACRERSAVLFSVDHHRGSEEHQLNEEYHDPALYDAEAGLMDSWPEFRRNLRAARLEDTVVPIVAGSELAARHWNSKLSLVFIDGGHSRQAALADYRGWVPHIVPGGTLAIHDVFEHPEEGGRAPFEIRELALASGLFTLSRQLQSLALLRRT